MKTFLRAPVSTQGCWRRCGGRWMIVGAGKTRILWKLRSIWFDESGMKLANQTDGPLLMPQGVRYYSAVARALRWRTFVPECVATGQREQRTTHWTRSAAKLCAARDLEGVSPTE